MTARHVYNVTCDHAGCGAKRSTDLETAKDARALAAADGWTTDKGLTRPFAATGDPRDFCPDHALAARPSRPRREIQSEHQAAQAIRARSLAACPVCRDLTPTEHAPRGAMGRVVTVHSVKHDHPPGAGTPGTPCAGSGRRPL